MIELRCSVCDNILTANWRVDESGEFAYVKPCEKCAQQITQLDKPLVVRFTEQKEAYKIKTPS